MRVNLDYAIGHFHHDYMREVSQTIMSVGIHSRAPDCPEFPSTNLGCDPFGFFRGFRNNINYSVERVESIDTRSRPLEDFHTLNFLKGDREIFPRRNALGINICGTSVNKKQHLIGEFLVVSSNADIELPPRSLNHGHARNPTE
jgi:hypothetical protein